MDETVEAMKQSIGKIVKTIESAVKRCESIEVRIDRMKRLLEDPTGDVK